MKQETIAGIVLCAIGIMIFVAPEKIWKLTEKWKSRKAEQPSQAYMNWMGIFGATFTGVGLLLCLGIIS